MGIDGFHQYTKHYLERRHIQQYERQRVGIDASGWLHRGGVHYAWDIYMKQQPWKNITGAQAPWVEFPIRMLNMLLSHDIEPVFVFDGCQSPAKAPTRAMRSAKKERARERAMEFQSQGRQQDAARMMQQAFDVTHDMAKDLIDELRKRRIEFIVAPYEADAQLAYLANMPVEKGGVHAIISEDSDLIAYGCPVVLFKSSLDGYVEELRKDVLLGPSQEVVKRFMALEEEKAACVPADEKKKTLKKKMTKRTQPVTFDGWTDDQMCLLCILSGCDFLPSIHGMGFKRAHEIVARAKTMDKALRQIRQNKRWQPYMKEGYVANVAKAFQTFRYSLVYDVSSGRAVFMRELPEDLAKSNDLVHLGPSLDQDLVQSIVKGLVHPHSKRVYTEHRHEKGPIQMMMPPPRETPTTATTTQQSQQECCSTGGNNNMSGDNTHVKVEENANTTEKKKRQSDSLPSLGPSQKEQKKMRKKTDLVLHPKAIQAARRKIRDYFKTIKNPSTSANLLHTNNHYSS